MARAIDLDKAIEIIEEKQKELCPVGNYGRHYVYDSDREKYDAWEEIIDALNALSTLTPPNEWVSVEERLPEEKQRVIVRCERVGTSVGWILWGNWMTDIGPDAGKVTHWRPLPAPPDKDNNVPAKTPNEPMPVLVNDEPDREYIDYICPRCKDIISQRRRGQRMETVYQCKYHDNCGQRMDWSNPQPYRRPPEGEADA